jgi:hypothetical protein
MANVLNANILNVGAVNYVRNWTLDGAQTLIRLRRHYNDRFQTQEHGPLWNRIAQRIGVLENLLVTGNQCKSKWSALKLGYENMKRILEGNPDGFPVHSPNNYDRRLYGDLSDEFWVDNRNYLLFII